LDFLEIPLLDPAHFDLQGTKRLLREFGLGATCSLGLPVQASLPERPREAAAFLGEALRAAAELGSPVLTGVIYGTLGGAEGHPPRQDELAVVAETLSGAAEQAASLGLRIGIEPVNRYETYLVNTARQGLELIRAIGRGSVFLHLDTYHMNIEEAGFATPIREAGSDLGYIHLSESNRGIPGEGNVRWEEVFSALAQVSYRGDLVMESFVAPSPQLARATCIWRPVTERPGDVVARGLPFLREQARRAGLPVS
jgi:D-psicose/D-tagatose/L-ribulose 3-epimerase